MFNVYCLADSTGNVAKREQGDVLVTIEPGNHDLIVCGPSYSRKIVIPNWWRR